MKVGENFIERFDKALDLYMTDTFGTWRTTCHQSALIAKLAIRSIHPTADTELLRVELLAHMEGSERLVHVGWADDPNVIEGKFPMHFATKVGSALYDPTFWQLTRVRTPLVLPKEPYLFQPGLANRLNSRQFTWMRYKHKDGPALMVGYKRVEAQLPAEVAALQLSEGLARRHAKKVASIFAAL